KHKVPGASIEGLTPDFLDYEEDALRIVLAERPDVFNHNIETARRLHPRMRGAKASYAKALWLLRRAKEVADYPVLTKSGIIVGLGETNDEIVETMRDLRENGVDVVTIGQHLQPNAKHARIAHWGPPDEFPPSLPVCPRATTWPSLENDSVSPRAGAEHGLPSVQIGVIGPRATFPCSPPVPPCSACCEPPQERRTGSAARTRRRLTTES